MAIVCLVRHGQASFGAADYDALSDLGREQAVAAGDELARRGVRDPLLVSGTLRRQRDTAALLGLGAVAVEDRRWDEYDHLGLVRARAGGTDADAAWTGDSRAFQTHLDAALRAWMAGDLPGWDRFRDDAAAALDDVVSRLTPGRDAVVVTSGGVIATVVGGLLGVGADGVVALNRVVVNAGVTTVLVGSSGVNLLSWNEHAYLGAARTYR